MAKNVSRRTVIGILGGSAIAGAAGCIGDGGDDAGAGGDDTSDDLDAGGDAAADQGDTTPTENVIYALAPDRIAVIEPEGAEVVAEIAGDFSDVDWGDPLASPDNRRLFINDGTAAQVVVVDTEAQEVETRLDVGPGPTHMYHPPEAEIWTHADGDGTFYLFDVEDLQVVDAVTAAQGDSGHGKLASHEALGDTGYATNTEDPGIHVVDIDAREATDFIETHDDGGTHAIRYNPVSGHVYVEGSRDARTAVVDTEDGTVVDYYEITGHIYNTPDDAYVTWVNEEAGVHVLDAEQGELVAEIPVDGAPDKIYFHDDGDTVYGFTANTRNDQAAVIDFGQLDVVGEIEVGDILRPEGAQFLHRGGLTVDGWFVTPASGDGVVSIVDAAAHELHAMVDVGEGVDTVAHVGRFE